MVQFFGGTSDGGGLRGDQPPTGTVQLLEDKIEQFTEGNLNSSCGKGTRFQEGKRKAVNIGSAIQKQAERSNHPLWAAWEMGAVKYRGGKSLLKERKSYS